jgi:lipopolysaccharide export system protein LptA
LHALSLAALLACAMAHAQELPQAEEQRAVADADLTREGPSPQGGEPTRPSEVFEIHSSGYSRFEIGDDGQIVVVYSGGVEFSYLGSRLRADELHFDQASRTADVSGDVQFETEDFVLSTQRVRIDGMAGKGEVSGHIVGNLKQSGVRFEADDARLTFPPEATELSTRQMQLVLAGSVAVYTRDGAELRTDEVALDGSTGRFSSAPFTLKMPLEGQGGQPATTLQVTGTAFGGSLSEDGQVSRVGVLGVLAVSPLGRFSAEQADAHPAADGWEVEASGSDAPIRLEYSAPLIVALSSKQPEMNIGPVLLEARAATLRFDAEGLKSAALKGGVTMVASGFPLGNRLALGSVSIDRRQGGMALNAGGVSLGLDLAHMLGIEPVDLSDLIK